MSAPADVDGRAPTSAWAAVCDDRDRIARRLNVDVIRGLFGIGLRLQATAEMVDGTARARLELAIHDLDQSIAEVRGAVFDGGMLLGSGPTTQRRPRTPPDSGFPPQDIR